MLSSSQIMYSTFPQGDHNRKSANPRKQAEQPSLSDSTSVAAKDARKLEQSVHYNTLSKTTGSLADGKSGVLTTDDWAAADASAAEIMASLRRSNSELALQIRQTSQQHYDVRPGSAREPLLSARSSLPTPRSIGEGG